MKYLKLFENYKDYYQHISKFEWGNSVLTIDKLDNRDISIIKDKVEELSKSNKSTVTLEYPELSLEVKDSINVPGYDPNLSLPIWLNVFLHIYDKVRGKKTLMRKKLVFTISRSQDEWYYINSDGALFYKCDQLGGVLECIEQNIEYLV
jgi:predicted Zn-dependent protease